jgi:hypothetical protein
MRAPKALSAGCGRFIDNCVAAINETKLSVPPGRPTIANKAFGTGKHCSRLAQVIALQAAPCGCGHLNPQKLGDSPKDS